MATPSAPDPGYDEVRRKLHELGYLDGRIGRFVLSDLGAERSSTGGVVRAGAKAAVLAGPLLGGLLASAVVAANRPLLRIADGLVLWLYFAVLAGAALFLLDLLAALTISALARRRGVRAGDSLRASLLVAFPTLAYLVLLWLRAPPGATLASDVAFLLGAGAATLLVAWLAGLVSLAGIIGRTGSVPDRARRPLLSVIAVVVALVLAGVVARAVQGAGVERGAPASPFATAATHGPLILLGVDGLDAELVAALEPAGSVVQLLALFRAGAVFPLLRGAAQEPPQVWTTIATGVPEQVHGIRGAGAEQLPGVATPLRREGSLPIHVVLRFLLPTRTVPASGATRRARALWEIAALREASASIGWWASWPARDPAATAPGYVVSDRVLAKLLAGRDDDRDAAPAGFYGRLAAQFEGDRAALRARFDQRFVGVRDAEVARLAWESFLIDAWHLSTTQIVLGDPGVRALFVYLPGLEILRYRLPRAGGAAARAPAGEPVLALYVEWLTGALADLARRSPDATLVLVADRGRSAQPDAEGFVAVIGRRAQPGCVGAPVADLDVAPLTLELMGFPASRELQGRLPDRCLEPPGPTLARIATFGRKAIPQALPSGADDPELLERLRSLGYIR